MKGTANKLFTAAASGWFSLPPDLLAARQASLTLRDALTDLRPPTNPQAQLLEQIVDAASAGKPLPKVKPVLDYRAALAEHETTATVLRAAVEHADSRLGGLTQDLQDEIVTDHLRPALDAVLDETRTVLADLPETLTAEVLLQSDRDLSRQWRRLNELSTGYSSIRRAYGSLSVGRDVEHDLHHWFGEIRNRDQIDVTITREHRNLQLGDQSMPWPQTEPQRLAWLLRNGADLWLPLAEEQDGEWLRVFGERLEEQKVNRWNANAWRAQVGTA